LSVRKELPFKQVNDLALGQYPSILFQWFPAGKLVDNDKEFAIGDLAGTAGGKDGGSVKVNLKTGEWAEMNGGEPKGGDPISLYAWAFCGGKMGRACLELGASLGVPGCDPPKGAEVVPFKPRNPPREAEKLDWLPIVPPGDFVAEPKAELAKWDHVYTYYDRTGKILLRYVVRNDKTETADKEIRPLTYGVLNGRKGWHRKGPNDPKGLYGLERLDGRPVLLQEGEKKTDAVAPLLPGYACLSLTGGTGGKNCNDLAPLAGQVVVLVPDNDAGGVAAMQHIAALLADLKCTVMLVDTSSHGFPKGWDLGNAVEGKLPDGSEVAPWTAETLEEFLDRNRYPFDPDPGNVDMEPDLGEPNHDDDSDWLKDPEEHATPTEGVIPLGHDNGIFYYLSRSSGQVIGLTPSKHVELELIALADPISYWETILMFQNEKGGGWNHKKAATWMMHWCKQRGIFKPDRLRGRGAWLDEDRNGNVRAVLHLGEMLIVDGVAQRSLKLEGSQFIYVKASQLGQIVAPPVRPADAHKLLKMCQLLRWEDRNSATLAAGFIVVSAICGALPWRPSIWITGGSNSGKTTFLKDIIAPILGRGTDDGIALNVQSKTTEAGLRQALGSDARPVFFDEAEAEMINDKARMQSVIDLNRQSSSEGGAEIIKGTQNQSGAKRYRIRSSFMYSSINIILDHQADESRITVLGLYNPGPGEKEQARDRARWAELCALMAETVADPIWCAGMVARSVWLMKTIRKNAATFKLVIIEEMGNSRAGDQFGALLAGAYSLTSDREITLDEARKYLQRKDDDGKLVNDFRSAASIDAPKDEERLTLRLFQQRIKIDLGDKVIERTVGEAMEEAAKDTGTNSLADVEARNYQAALKRCGLKVEGEGVWIANKHVVLTDWLKDTPWSTQWGRSLKRIPGAKTSEPKVIVFGKWDRSKAVWVPFSAFEG
jgi:putative DNA primase/helicase